MKQIHLVSKVSAIWVATTVQTISRMSLIRERSEWIWLLRWTLPGCYPLSKSIWILRTWLYLLVRVLCLMMTWWLKVRYIRSSFSVSSNIHSIWKETCPPSDATRPSNAPASTLPTVEPISSPLEIHIPTLVPLSKPSLPTIIDAVPFIVPVSANAADTGISESDKNNYTVNGDDNIEIDKDASGNDLESSSDKYFQSNEFLSEWTSGNSANRDSTYCALNIELATTFALLTMLRRWCIVYVK